MFFDFAACYAACHSLNTSTKAWKQT